MGLQVGKFYELSISVVTRILKYQAEILPKENKDDDWVIRFRDRLGVEWSYNKSMVINFTTITKDAMGYDYIKRWCKNGA